MAFQQNGVKVRADKEGIPSYPYSNAAQDSWTVSEWITKRFKSAYPGYDVVVRSKIGAAVMGHMKLSNIR